MVDAYRKHMMDNDDVSLMKTRRMSCMPIQADVLPRFGFEPTVRGVAQASAAVTAPELMKDPEVLMLNHQVMGLTRDWPQQVALEGAVG